MKNISLPELYQKNSVKKMAVKRVAIIGGGPSGIATLHELTRVLEKGKSLFGAKDVSQYSEDELAFSKVTLFERNSSTGGAWSDSVAGKHIDPKLPKFSGEDYDKADSIFEKGQIPEGIEASSYENPVIVEESADTDDSKYDFQWRGTGVYEGLFTNIPAKYMSYSFDEFDFKSVSKDYPLLNILQPATDVGDYLKGVVERNNLAPYIRLNSTVENVNKKGDVWYVTIREEIREKGLVKQKWYREEYDAVVIGNGKTIPIFPKIKNFSEIVKTNNNRPEEEQILITHVKSIENPIFLKSSKKILVIGSNVSAADLIQYAYPRTSTSPDVFVSRRSKYQGLWTDFALYSHGITNKVEVEEFIPESNGVKFKDGSVETGFDVILIATGYHMHYPFLDKEYFETHERVTDFFLYTFSLSDPTLALVGNTYAPFFFNRVEAQGAALAGVWGGFTELPTAEEQAKTVDDPIVNQLTAFNIKGTFIDRLLEFAVEGRPSPFETHERQEHVRDLAESRRTIEKLFFDLKEGRYTAVEVITKAS